MPFLGLRRLAAALLALAAFSTSSHAAGNATYDLVDLGPNIEPQGISNNGVVVGKDVSTDPPSAIYYHPRNSLTTLKTSGVAMDAGNNGIVAGYNVITADEHQGQIWLDTQAVGDLDTFSNLQEARGANGFNEVVGVRLDDQQLRRAFRYDYTTGTLYTLPTLGGAEGWANDISDNGYITGSMQDSSGAMSAFDYRHTTDAPVKRDPPSGYQNSEGLSINSKADIAGWAYNDIPDSRGKRAILSGSDSGIRNLGVLDNDTDSIAKGVNQEGLVVGQSIRVDKTSRAFIYDLTKTAALVLGAHPTNPLRIYTGSAKGEGMARSDDRGVTWVSINRGLTNLNIWDIDFLASNPDVMYVATEGGIFKSNNGGDSWILISTGLNPNYAVYAVSVNSAQTNLIFAGTSVGLFYSRDAGASWVLLPPTENVTFSIFNLEEDPNDPNSIYVATVRGLYRIKINPENNDITWDVQRRMAANDATTDLSPRISIYCVAVSPTAPRTVYIGTTAGIYYSRIEGDSLAWTKSTSYIASTMTYANNGNLYAGTSGGLYKLASGSSTWTKVTAYGNNGIFELSMSNDAVNTLYVSGNDGSLKRSDNSSGLLGNNWTSLARGVSAADVYTFSFVPDDPQSIGDQSEQYLGGSSGAFVHRNIETTWHASQSGAANIKIISLGTDNSTSPTTVWAGTSDQGVYKSVDGGLNWLQKNEGLNHWNIQSIAVDNTVSPTTVYAGTLGGAYRSDDAGATWEYTSSGLKSKAIFSLFLDKDKLPYILYAGTEKGVFRSFDKGANWVATNTGIENEPISDLEKDSANNQLYALSRTSGIYKSNDGGVTWQILADVPGKPSVNAIALDHAYNPAILYAGTTQGVYKYSSSDGGLTWAWSDASGTALGNLTVFALEVDVKDKIYAGLDDNAVYISKNGGTDWSIFDEGLSEVVTSLHDLSTTANISGWRFSDAIAINDSGQIVGIGYNTNSTTDPDVPHGVLLTPTIGVSQTDLVISQTITPDTIRKNTPVDFHISVRNAGPNTATGVRLNNWLPANTAFRFSGSSGGTCTVPRDLLVRCSLGEMTPGQVVNVAISVSPTAREQRLNNFAMVTGNEKDPDMSNNITDPNQTAKVDRCFIATAAYGSFLDPHVEELRHFRDHYLMTNGPGRWFVETYYEYSPSLAQEINEHEWLRQITVVLLTPLVYGIKYPLGAAVLLSLILVMKIKRRRTRLRRQAILLEA